MLHGCCDGAIRIAKTVVDALMSNSESAGRIAFWKLRKFKEIESFESNGNRPWRAGDKGRTDFIDQHLDMVEEHPTFQGAYFRFDPDSRNDVHQPPPHLSFRSGEKFNTKVDLSMQAMLCKDRMTRLAKTVVLLPETI